MKSNLMDLVLSGIKKKKERASSIHVNKYSPHQGKKECARRVRKLANISK